MALSSEPFVLNALPSEILGQILTGSASHLSLLLWKCGNASLNAKLARSVTEVDLIDTAWTSTSRYPKLLSSFKNLRKLSIIRGNGYLMGSSKDLNVEIHKLASSLLELAISSAEAERAFLIHSPTWTIQSPKFESHTYERGESRVIDLESLFPTLQRLLVISPNPGNDIEPLGGVSCLPALPKSLTSLELEAMATNIALTDLSAMPPNLRFWKGSFVLPPEADYSKSTVALERLHEVSEQSIIERLPPSITLLDKHGFLSLYTVPRLRLLPKGLKTLRIRGILPPTPEDGNWTSALPNQLVELSLLGFPYIITASLIQDLPRTLTTLWLLPRCAGMDWEDIAKLGAETTTLWPNGLRCLSFAATTAEIQPHIKCLPKTLDTLHMRLRAPRTLSIATEELPPQLTELKLEYMAVGIVLGQFCALSLSSPFPETLKSLRLCDIGTSLANLPSQLHDLTFEVSDLPLSSSLDRSELPRLDRLQRLELNRWSWRWLDVFPPSLTSLSINMIKDYDSSLNGENVDLFAALPSSLVKLLIKEESSGVKLPVLSALSFSNLRSLKRIHITSQVSFKSGVMRHWPKSIGSVLCFLDGVAPEDAPYFPQRAHAIQLGLTLTSRDDAVDSHFPLLAFSPTDVYSSLDDRIIGARFTEAKRRARMYPDPRILE